MEDYHHGQMRRLRAREHVSHFALHLHSIAQRVFDRLAIESVNLLELKTNSHPETAVLCHLPRKCEYVWCDRRWIKLCALAE